MTLPKFRTWELVLLAVIVVIGGFLRLFNLDQTLMFRGDQGRDALIAKHILKDGDIALIGPITSVGNMYLGPFYYYFMVPFLGFSYPSPLGPAYGVALVNIATLIIFYLVVRQLFSLPIAPVATLLLAVMPSAVQYSRFSWNPNIAPLFAVLLFWNISRWWQTRSLKDALFIWIWIGVLIQLHYVALTVVGVVGIIMLANVILRKEYKLTLVHGLLGVCVLVLTQLPLILFDFRHDHLISERFMEFFTSDEQHISSIKLSTQANKIIDKFNFVVGQLMNVSFPFQYQRIAVFVMFLTAVMMSIRSFKKPHHELPTLLTIVWLGTTSIGIAFYSHTVFAHYLTYTYPIIALFWALVISWLWNWRRVKLLAPLVLCLLVLFSWQGLSSLAWSGLGTKALEATVNASLPHIHEPYNVVLLSDDKDYKGMSYRYFFEAFGKKPKEPEDYSDLKTLVIIDEVDTDNPLSVPIYEIQSSKDLKHTETIRVNEATRVLILKKE